MPKRFPGSVKRSVGASPAQPNVPTPIEQTRARTPSPLLALSPAPSGTMRPNGLTPVSTRRGSEASCAVLSPAEMRAKSDERPEAVVVNLLAASDLPRLVQLNRSSLSPYAVMWVIDHTGRQVGRRVEWTPRPSTRNPVWNCAHDLGLPPMTYHELSRSLLHQALARLRGRGRADPRRAAAAQHGARAVSTEWGNHLSNLSKL